MKSGFWKTDWFFGLVVALGVLLLSNSNLLQSIERKAYDLGVLSSTQTPLDKIAVIAIDDASIANIGPWPWSPVVHAKMAEILAGANAKIIATTSLISGSQADPGAQFIGKLLDIAGGRPTVPASPTSGATPDADAAASALAVPPGELGQFVALLREADNVLNTDRKMVESFSKTKNVILPLSFSLGEARPTQENPLPEYVTRNAIPGGQPGPAVQPLRASGVQIPPEPLGKAAVALGHVNSKADIDGVVRTEPLAILHLDRLYPSLAMMIAARSLNLAPGDIKVLPGEGLALGKLQIPADSSLQAYTHFYKDRDGKSAFQADSFLDVYTGKIDPAKRYRDKIVLIGVAAGAATASVTPVSPALYPVFTLAHSVSSILQGHTFATPAWGWAVEKGLFLVIAAYLIVLFPRLATGPAVVVTAGIVVALVVIHFVLMSQGMWVQLMVPVVLAVVGHAALAMKRLIAGAEGKSKPNANAAESARMLGLAYQGQGQLDKAWDQFRVLPLSDALMDNLYILALDFEKKREIPKAEAVFRHMYGHDPKYRDIETRLSPAKPSSETVILGSGGAPKKAGAPKQGTSAGKMMLGRYQIEKELGKGAMGVVYLGKDPKIGRVVAIKTMALAQEFEADELAEVKERFFREAETAGRLAHQNIVTIYDAGEEHDLAFIAMELLKGGDLTPFTKPGALLSIDKAISIAARTADALGYAHKQGVVHRDIKPANIMYHLETDTVKVTDFGIARLTDSSKTKTGMVLGTPSYMSPEQLAGKQIDGRSDLFSLAVSLYLMLCGKLPFEGASMGRLMFAISSEPPADILTINPNVPPAVVAFLNRAMEKEPDARFQTGEAFSAALREAARAGGAIQPAPQLAASAVDIQL